LLGNHKPWGPFRGGKYSGFEAGTRIPQIVRWPAKVKPTVSNALVTQLDWYASFASLTGYKLKQGEAPDSHNAISTMLGIDKRNRSYVVKQNISNVLSIVIGDWKYIEPSKFPEMNKETNIELGNNKTEQLYNLKTDPGEKNNLSSKFPQIVIKLKNELETIRNKK
jgi:arylsulfatase A-like enzyme